MPRRDNGEIRRAAGPLRVHPDFARRIPRADVPLAVQLASGTHFRGIPLVDQAELPRLLARHDEYLLTGIAATVLQPAGENYQLVTTVITPLGITVPDFLRFCIAANEAVAPDELVVPHEAFESVIECGVLAVSGVSKWTHYEDEADSFAMLHVPKPYYELDQPHPEYPVTDFASDIASGLFATVSAASIQTVAQNN